MTLASLRSALRWVPLWALALTLGCSSGGGRTTNDSGTLPATCSPTCTPGMTCCSGPSGSACVDLTTDATNCGACGISCGANDCVGGVCSAVGTDGGGVDSSGGGSCAPSCSSSQRCCGTTCANRQAPAGVLDARTDTSFANCNGCGLACDPERASVCGQQLGGSGPPQCLCGNFAQCPVGQTCVSNGGTFTCSDPSSDPTHCGAAGTMCAEGESCVGGACVCGSTGAACGAGQACCGGACVDTTSDAMNCGACGMACSAGESCSGGSCGCGSSGVACRAPTAGVFGMGGDPGESCCGGTCVANTDSSCACAACDTAAGESCQVGGGGILPGMGGGAPQVCCGDTSVALLGCGGGGLGDGGLPGGDGGLPFP